MKLAELLQGPKPSPSPMPRASRGGAAEGKPSDFAGALTEARNKPEPKRADAEAPVGKKPSASRKGKAAKDERAPAEDMLTAEDAVKADEPQDAAVDETPAAGDAAPKAEDEADAPLETDEAEADPNVTLIAIAQATGPQLPPAAAEAQRAETDVDYMETRGQMICPPKMNHPAQPTADVEDEGDAESLEGDAMTAVAESLLEGFDDVVDGEAEGLSDDVAFDDSSADAPVATAPPKHAAAPVAPVDAAEQTELETPKDKEPADAQAPALSSDSALNADANVGDEPPGSASNTAGVSAASPSSTPTAHVQPEGAKPQATSQAPAAPAPPPPPAQFAEVNHPKIVTAVQTQALTNGGTMQIRLDPPELGALQVMVHMQDGVMTASFHTSNDDATKLLSHSLSQLKQVLESQGVSVARLQVSQASKDQHAQNDDPRQSPRDPQHDAHRQEQQRKEMLRRMWRRLSNGSDPLDLVA